MGAMREELGRICAFEERHRRLLARLALLVIATAVINLLGGIAMYLLERHAAGSEIRTFGQALFFSTTQILTVSSSLANPVTPAGRCVDIVLEAWACIAVAGSAGAIASFFQTGDAAG